MLAWPTATYRLQFNSAFRFPDAERILPYLSNFGVSHVYASPLLVARPGSAHGYDVVDPTRINPELGEEGAFVGLVQEARKYGLGLILDIVPNHMAADHRNPWWTETLALGPKARHARVFDIDWSHPYPGKLVLPVLGEPLDQVLAKNELELVFEDSWWWWRYYERLFPLSPATLQLLAHENQAAFLNPDVDALTDLCDRVERGEPTEPWIALRRNFQNRFEIDKQFQSNLFQFLQKSNKRRFNSEKPEQTFVLLDREHYVLEFWRDGLKKINYRRFFDIADLAGVRVEDPDVFAWTHEKIIELYRDGLIDGVRIDHIDGLIDPSAYLDRLREALRANRPADSATEPYVVVEKILSGDESLPKTWPVQGTTGYEFANRVNALFVHPEGFDELKTAYAETDCEPSLAECAYKNKRAVISELFAAELDTLESLFNALLERVPEFEAGETDQVRDALIELTACLPVYRTYIAREAPSGDDKRYLHEAVAEAIRRRPDVAATVFDAFARLVGGRKIADSAIEDLRHAFIARWQQFTGPAMAKGFEDTALYDWFVLASLNEVGAPHEPGALTLEKFHAWNAERAGRYHGLNCLSTHDTKRSEDARARIDVISEMAREWGRTLRQWQDMNRPLKPSYNGQPVPDDAFESFLYQNLVAIWDENASHAELKERLSAFALKSARERKRHTSWVDGNETYEKQLGGFVERVFANPDFLTSLDQFVRQVAPWGRMNSLAQTLITLVAPGVPDLYRGNEIFDFSLVDPDNRRPVDFAYRQSLLDELQARRREDTFDFADPASCDRAKLRLVREVLNLRRNDPDLFDYGEYEGVYASGPFRDHVIACVRRHQDRWVVAAAPRFARKLSPNGLAEGPIGKRAWGDSFLLLPELAPEQWTEKLTGQTVNAPSGRMPLADLFARFPFAVAVARANASVPSKR